MTRESTDIEVEVVEIDGVTADAAEPLADHRREWGQYRGRIRLLDNRWWPLWVILGIVALVLFLTVGLLIGLVFLIVGLFVKLLRAILR